MNEAKTFSCNDNGFSIKFPNGLTLSTRFGYANYCENRDNEKLLQSFSKNAREPYESLDSNTAEIAVIREAGEFARGKEGDSVKGYVEIKEWLEVFEWCKNWQK
jgi:hypothetical protein